MLVRIALARRRLPQPGAREEVRGGAWPTAAFFGTTPPWTFPTVSFARVNEL